MCCLGTGLLLSSTTNAQTTAQPKSETQRIQDLEKKIFQAARYIEGLHRELQKIKRSAGIATPPAVATPPPARSQAPPQAPAPPPGQQHAMKGSAPESRAERQRRRKAQERLEEEERVSQDQEEPEPELQASFLKQANAVLIGQGRLEIEPSLAFRHTNRNELILRGIDLIENIFIGTNEVGRLKRSVLTNTYSIRYGLTNRIQLNLAIPFQRTWRQNTLSPSIQRQVGEPTEETSSDGGLGDISGGVSVHLFQEGEWLPDVIWTTSFKSDSGDSPFEVDSGSLASGTGFWGARTGFTLVKISDPAVLFLSGGYFYHRKSSDVRGFDEVDPPDAIDAGFGLSYALNPFLSITTRFASSFHEKTEVNGLEIDGSDRVTAALGLGVTYALSGTRSLDVSAEFGLTDDSPDFTVRVSMPISVSLPPFWQDWKTWRLSRIFRF